MGSRKTREDEIYEQGVRDGQGATLLDQVVHGQVKGWSLPSNRRETDIYNKGFEYGVTHRPILDTASSNRGSRRSSGGGGGSSDSSGCGAVIFIIVVVVGIGMYTDSRKISSGREVYRPQLEAASRREKESRHAPRRRADRLMPGEWQLILSDGESAHLTIKSEKRGYFIGEYRASGRVEPLRGSLDEKGRLNFRNTRQYGKIVAAGKWYAGVFSQEAWLDVTENDDILLARFNDQTILVMHRVTVNAAPATESEVQDRMLAGGGDADSSEYADDASGVEPETGSAAPLNDTAETSAVAPVLSVDAMLQRIVNGETVDVQVRYDAKAVNSERGERLMLCCVVSLMDGAITLTRDRFTFESDDGTVAFSVPYEKIVSLSDRSNRISLRVKVLNSTRSREYIKRIQVYNRAATAADSKSGPDEIICGSCDNSLDELYALLKVLRKNR